MPALVQICIVIATLALIVMAVMVMIVLLRLGNELARLTQSIQIAIIQIEHLTQETRDTLSAVRDLVTPAKGVWQRIQRLGDRAVDLSTAVLDEIEVPVVTGIALARGVKAGTAQLLETLIRRIARRSSSQNGDQSHE